jgi:hypothetical protein
MHKQINLVGTRKVPVVYPWKGAPPVTNQIDLFMHFPGMSRNGQVARPVEMDKLSSSVYCGGLPCEARGQHMRSLLMYLFRKSHEWIQWASYLDVSKNEKQNKKPEILVKVSLINKCQPKEQHGNYKSTNKNVYVGWSTQKCWKLIHGSKIESQSSHEFPFLKVQLFPIIVPNVYFSIEDWFILTCGRGVQLLSATPLMVFSVTRTTGEWPN